MTDQKNVEKNKIGTNKVVKTANAKNAKPVDEAKLTSNLEQKALDKAIEIMEAWVDAPGNPEKSNNWSRYAADGREDVRKVLSAVKSGGKNAGESIITANLWDAGYDYDDSRKGYTMGNLCDASSFISGSLSAVDFLKKFGKISESKEKEKVKVQEKEKVKESKAKESEDEKFVELYNKHKSKIERLKEEFRGKGQFGNDETFLRLDLIIKVFEKHPNAASEVTCRMPALANYSDVKGFNASFELFNEMENSDQVRMAAHILGEIAVLAHPPWKYMEVVDLLKKHVKNEKILGEILLDDDIEYPGSEELDAVLGKYKKKYK